MPTPLGLDVTRLANAIKTELDTQFGVDAGQSANRLKFATAIATAVIVEIQTNAYVETTHVDNAKEPVK